jgi:crotonobetainyl-CoA:carnitine CoA-transferase CaiB-like acyl-CoA transferase
VVGRYQGFTRAIAFSRTPGPAPFAAPVFGADSDRVMAEHGFTEQQIAELRASGALL